MNFPKTNAEFYELILNKKILDNFLKFNNLLTSTLKCRNPKCKNNPDNLILAKLKGRPVKRCRNSGCKRHYSARSDIFKLNNSSKLENSRILEIIWYWSQKHSVKYTTEYIRSILYEKLSNAAPIGRPGYSVQIDESLFHGRRKYNRGRLLKGDKKPKNEKSTKPQNSKKRNYGNRVKGPGYLGWLFKSYPI
jgi:hypothetical protein